MSLKALIARDLLQGVFFPQPSIASLFQKHPRKVDGLQPRFTPESELLV